MAHAAMGGLIDNRLQSDACRITALPVGVGR